jgi:hypothetical protein
MIDVTVHGGKMIDVTVHGGKKKPGMPGFRCGPG